MSLLSDGSSGDDEPRNLLLHLEVERNDLASTSDLELTLGSLESVVHEHGDGHGSDSSGNRGDVGSDGGSGSVVDVTNKALTRLLGCIWS